MKSWYIIVVLVGILSLGVVFWQGSMAGLRAAAGLPTVPSASAKEAPEFAGITDWIQSDPLTIRSLRGKVVIVHFWTNGCINCQHNYPHYRQWTKDFEGKDVVIVGVHTPEFDWEADVARIREQVKKNGLKFPVAVDTDGETWRAWHNKYWPAIYVVDKAGRVRFEWSGELTSGGNKGNEIVRDKVLQLVDEKL
jgi:peroxiredoxin